MLATVSNLAAISDRYLPDLAAPFHTTLVQLVSRSAMPTIRVWIPRSTHEMMRRSANTHEQLL